MKGNKLRFCERKNKMKKLILLGLLLITACGKDGTNGLNGAPGTKITSVQFCPGNVTYPTIFPEIGFCIEGNLYAVYSANDGFLTEIPPGQYLSNAIGSSCNFTVLPNCVISN
jgi:hypothetical protein